MLVRQPTRCGYYINRNLGSMKDEQKLKELEEKIWQLSADINSNQHQLLLLQAQLHSLKEDPGQIDHKKISDQKPVLQKASSTSFIHNDGLENYIGLRLIHLAGIVVLVIGLSIGVKYAVDRQLISEVMRIVLAYAAGGALFILSFRLKKKYQLFSAILFSGSAASVYFTTYAACVYYNFFPPLIAFVIMTALTIYTVVTAINYNRQEIAILGMTGAYGIPFLISANAERIDLFFS